MRSLVRSLVLYPDERMIPAYGTPRTDPGVPATELPVETRCPQHEPTLSFQSFSRGELHTEVERQSAAFSRTGQKGLKYLACSPHELHLHPALARLNIISSLVELTQAAQMTGRSTPVPILITSNGTIIGGFRDWHQAVSDGRPLVDCIEYSMSEEEALEFILIHHQAAQNWNDFVRIRLALEMEPSLQKKALDNQIAGGKYKGSANLPKPDQIDVRRDIARFVGVGARNVSNVKTILRKAHPALIDALSNGTLTIHRALEWCTLTHAQQKEQFTMYSVERATKKAIHRSLASLRKQKAAPDPLAVLRTLRNREVREPGSLLVRTTRLQRTVILLGRDFFSSHSEMESESSV